MTSIDRNGISACLRYFRLRVLGALDPPPIGDFSRSTVGATLPTVASPSFSDEPSHDDDHLGESVLKRADERTRTADLVSLRVIIHALQRFARGCKSRKSRPVSLLWLAQCCTVLRSRWCQSGVNITLVSA